jgi:hypothetical protein
MGQVVNFEYEIITKLDNTIVIGDNKLEIIGLARVVYKNDEIDTYSDVEFPDPEDHPNTTLRIALNGKELTDDSGDETDLFNEIHDIISEILQSEITPDKTDITDEDLLLSQEDQDNLLDYIQAIA